MPRFGFSSDVIEVESLRRSLEDPACGGYAAFEGWVRNLNEGRRVNRLEYEAFESLAVREGERIIAEACARFGVTQARCVHRIGDLPLGEIAVWVGVAAPHRDEAFRACRYIIDEVKHRVPIWKKEHYEDGDSGWVNCERCATAGETASDHHHHQGHHHHHDHHHHSAPAVPGPVPDYSRQTTLPEVGVAGQRKLAAARIAVIGAGGLGVPVLQFLAGAGVGKLVIVDGDVLEASNLHRQCWYALADCGQPKAALAAARVAALNPTVTLSVHTTRLDATNIATLLAGCDIVIDCTDNFSSQFLLNDHAQQSGTPTIFASVHQYEGQLQVVDPSRGDSCLRCIWPNATRDGLVGNCAEAGVLGPVPGVLGTLQALETLKILLDLPGRLKDELLLIDLLGCKTTRIRAPRHPQCVQNCSRLPATTTSDISDLELQFSDLQAACDAGYQLIDIRDSEELAQQPLTTSQALCLSANELIAGRNLPAEGRYLLVCSRGKRSLATCQALRERGLSNVYSLRGGAQGLS